MEQFVSRFFRHLFENRQRRLALLGRFLCVFRTEYDTPVQLCTFYLHTIACETSAFQLEPLGMRLTQHGFFIPYTWLTEDEKNVIRVFLDKHKELFNHVEWEDRLRVVKEFKYDSHVFPPLHRRLLLRDYCTMCMLQAHMGINPRIPTYALMACKDLLANPKHADNGYLHLVHWMLDGLWGNAHELPVIDCLEKNRKADGGVG